jgi:predicted Zn finger-like uncharacterized protein
MKTQCPHCQTRFNTPQESKGSKIKCTNCSNLFVIEKLVETLPVEVCTQCGNVIGRIEQACIFKGDIVCPKCDTKLRKIESIQSPQTEVPKATLEKVKNTNKSNVSIAGVIVSFILFFFAFSPIMNNQFFKTQHRPTYTVNPDAERFEQIGTPIIFCGTGLILFIRSLLPGLGFWRGVLTVIGAYFVFGVAFLVFFMLPFMLHGSPNSAALIGTLLPGFIGGIMVAYGFKPKKGLRKKR